MKALPYREQHVLDQQLRDIMQFGKLVSASGAGGGTAGLLLDEYAKTAPASIAGCLRRYMHNIRGLKTKQVSAVVIRSIQL